METPNISQSKLELVGVLMKVTDELIKGTDTQALALMLNAVTGAVLMCKEQELVVALMPIVTRWKEEYDAASGESADLGKFERVDEDDFFDKNEFIS